MKEKRYSISQIQQIIDISPNDLKKLIRKNSGRINLQTCEMPDGSKETYLDEESFKKLLFFKHLESGVKLSVDEVCELINEKKLKEDDEEVLESQLESRFDQCLRSVEEEVEQLRSQMTRMLIKYDHCLKELNISRSKNIVLENEMKKLKTREAGLMGQIRKFAAEHFEEEISLTELN